MRRLMSALALLHGVFIAAAFSFVMIGRAESAAPAFASSAENCHFPCWNTITPRTTPLDSANAITQSHGYRLASHDVRFRVISYHHDNPAACDVSLNYHEGVVLMILLRNCPSLRLGDIIAQFGMPDHLMHDTKAVSFLDGRIIAHLDVPDCYFHLSPRDHVSTLYLLTPGSMPRRRRIMDYTPGDAVRTFAWRGWMSRSAYRAANSGFPIC
jgi:hypothetical protein